MKQRNVVQRWLRWMTHNPQLFNAPDEKKRRAFLVLSLQVSGIPFLYFFTVVELLHDNRRELAFVLLASSVLMTACYCVVRFTQRMEEGAINTSVLFALLTVYLLMTGSVDGTGSYWALASAPTYFAFLGYRRGSFAVLCMMVIYGLLLFIPNNPLMQSEYTTDHKLRFLFAYLLLAMLSAAQEYARFSSQQRLEKISQRYEKQARTDILTGLANRREMVKNLKLAERRSTRDYIGLLLIDIDRFKQINDTYGHHCGDEVIRMVSRSMSNFMRSTDMVARWGGEEFLTLVQCANLDGARFVAEKLRQQIENLDVECDGRVINVTVCIGVAVAENGESVEELLRIADENLYSAKRSGRNCVV